MVQSLHRPTQADESNAPAEHRERALVCRPFLRGTPLLSEEERGELRRLVEVHFREE